MNRGNSFAPMTISPPSNSRANLAAALWPYCVLFFISGCPALLYQIVWQRALFAIYGVNIETVTIIVTIFMVGLGFGSLAGGRLSKIRGLPVLRVFGLIEIGIGLYGAASLSLFQWASLWTAGASAPVTAVITVCLLLIPTLLMGSTLPLLVTHAVRTTRNVGQSVGLLYAVNTLGSASACIAAAFFLMRWLGQAGSVWVGVALNLVVGCSALLLSWVAAPLPALGLGPAAKLPDLALRPISFRMGLGLSVAAGIISLGYEMVWYRLYSFASGGAAPVFALLLGSYLAGIALGSFIIHDFCAQQPRHDTDREVRVLGGFILWGGIIAFLVAPALTLAVRSVPLVATFPMVIVGASLVGAAFPLISHVVIHPEEQAGSRLSYLYIANIIGSATGSFVVGFILMDYLSLRGICFSLLALALLSAAVLFWRHGHRPPSFAIAGATVAAIVILLSPQFFSKPYEKLLYTGRFSPEIAFRHVVETRSGVIAVSQDGIIFGGGVYDGRFNTDLVHDTNLVARVFAIPSFHSHPSEVLMIGLASGSWAQIVAHHPGVKHLTIIEINPGYLRLISQYPMVASVLKNPKVHITIDDGRRWLLRNSHEKFDLIVMNTTYSWRAHASNLLSMEFFRLARLHLNPGGILYYNATESRPALFTGATVFPWSLRVLNFLAVSDQPILVDKQRWEQLLSHYAIDGKPVLDLADPAQRNRMQEVLSLADTLDSKDAAQAMRMEPGASLRARLQGTRLITDDNMGDEWQPRVP